MSETLTSRRYVGQGVTLAATVSHDQRMSSTTLHLSTTSPAQRLYLVLAYGCPSISRNGVPCSYSLRYFTNYHPDRFFSATRLLFSVSSLLLAHLHIV